MYFRQTFTEIADSFILCFYYDFPFLVDKSEFNTLNRFDADACQTFGKSICIKISWLDYDFRILIVLDLTPHSHGNATGIGMADLTTRRVIDQIDWNATYMNVFTSGVLRSARMPIPLENDRAAIEVALARVPIPTKARMARIVNTGDLETFWASEAILPEFRKNAKISVDHKPQMLSFNEDLRLTPMKN